MKRDLLKIKQIKTYIYRILCVILTFFVNIIMTRFYSPDIVGMYYSWYSFITLLTSIIFLGFGYVIVRYVTPYYNNKSKLVEKNFLISLSIYMLIANFIIISSLIVILKDQILNYWLKDNCGSSYLLFSIIAVFFYTLIMFFGELFKAIKKVDISIVLVNGTINIFFALFLLWFKSMQNVKLIFILFIISEIFSIISVLILYHRLLKQQHIRLLNLYELKQEYYNNKLLCKTYCVENFSLAIVAVSNVLLNVFDTILLSAMVTFEQVAIYSIAGKVASLGSIILSTVNSIISYQLASSKDDIQLIGNIFIKYTKWMVLLGVVWFVFVAFFALCIPYIFGSSYKSSVLMCILLSFGQLISIVTGPCSYVVIMCGFFKRYTSIMVESAIMYVCISLILVNIIGIYGVVLSNFIVLLYKNIYTFVEAMNITNLRMCDFITSRVKLIS